MPSNLPLLLIVDDNPENLTVIGELLQPHYRLRAANGGARALRLAQLSPRPDLILLDVMMPDMDGHEVLDKLRSDPVTRDIPVVFLTTLNSAADEEEGLRRGAADYITKPIRPAILLPRVASLIERKRTVDLLHRRISDLEHSLSRCLLDTCHVQDSSLQALARTVEARNAATGRHLYRTQAYVRVMAENLPPGAAEAESLDPRAIELMVRSAALHDIGKVGIPDHILDKPGPLTPAERMLMETHVLVGVEIIERAEHDVDQRIDHLQIAKQMARSHHERWDGSGYPDRLSGMQIPLPARLVSVADAFDATLSRRAYKAGESLEVARREIIEGSGTQFDPVLVRVFEQCFDRFRQIAGQQAAITVV
jgi:putative two-component system response regulator